MLKPAEVFERLSEARLIGEHSEWVRQLREWVRELLIPRQATGIN
jgi:hypothetical protein